MLRDDAAHDGTERASDHGQAHAHAHEGSSHIGSSSSGQHDQAAILYPSRTDPCDGPADDECGTGLGDAAHHIADFENRYAREVDGLGGGQQRFSCLQENNCCVKASLTFRGNRSKAFAIKGWTAQLRATRYGQVS